MKLFLQLFLLSALFLNTVCANDFREIQEIRLKKDEQKKILVKYESFEKLFKFRWTLFTNGGLVVFKSYDKIVSQNMLYLRHKNQSLRVELKSKGADPLHVPYMLLKFKEFNYETKEAVFAFMLWDEKMQVNLKYLPQ